MEIRFVLYTSSSKFLKLDVSFVLFCFVVFLMYGCLLVILCMLYTVCLYCILPLWMLEDNLAEGEEVEYGYPITCGESKAVLLFKKFVCPGINVRCVKVPVIK